MISPARDPWPQWWEICVLTWGMCRNSVFYSRHLGPRFVELLPFVPVRCLRRGDVLTHDEVPVKPEDVAGMVHRAWYDDVGVYAAIELATEEIGLRRALSLAQRDGRVHQFGISIMGRVEHDAAAGIRRSPDGHPRLYASDVLIVSAVDVVSRPASDAHVIRSLPEPQPTQEDSHAR